MNCLKLASNLCLGALIAVAACSTPKDDTTGESSSSSSSSSGGSEPTGGQEATSVPDSTTTTGGMSAEGTDTSDGSSSTGPFIPPDSTTGGCPDPENQDNNASCTDATGCGCKSGKCFLVPILGGFCGECLVDADCTEGGCTVPNPLAMVGATCNMGEAGAGCMTDDVCSDPANAQCGVLLDVPGIITVGTCGECDGAAGNVDCVDPALGNCAPTYDVMKFSGKYVCVADNSIPQDGGCNLADNPDMPGTPIGNNSCVSGFCGKATVMGLLSLGICGECNSNADCTQGQTCTDPVVDLDAAVLVGSVCQ